MTVIMSTTCAWCYRQLDVEDEGGFEPEVGLQQRVGDFERDADQNS